ncbi:ABC transporter ATP-binding protein [Saccharopolyspora sp. ASAGF58]|uniref:ABC transporter ATP-binding protein n=1 Tax=Saccharopolyspora sp. ASAGF58 TaxID=2719023 RepID=UPI001440235A|nr:ATP-binding cassette domain-containing protein [Saccharopolyspora sp. ASAGF58]QIZ37357.1 ATP-binding cassette domain-containing protein [Saccharopolyspora sp. ASAGF58]
MVLHIDDVSVQYGAAVRAVQGCTLEVGEGQLVSVIGQNGAGKSTLLKAVMGLIPLAGGSIRVDDVQVGSRAFSPVRSQLSYVPERGGVFANLSVGENLRLGGVACKDKAAVAARIERELERFPVLRKYWGRGASLLSGGEQQQLAIARALILDPRLLLLDEPTLGLAPIIIDLIFDVIAGLRAEGTTILLVEQNAMRALEVSDRAYVLQAPGKVLGAGTAAELQDIPAVVDYLGFAPSEAGASQ